MQIITQFQKIAIAGITLIVFLLTILIVVFAIGQSSSDSSKNEFATHEPVITSQLQPEQYNHNDTNDFIENNEENLHTDDVSVGTRLGEMWIGGSNMVYEVLSDFDDVVGVTDFFRFGYREFIDAVRANNDEEFIEITVIRLANKNEISVISVDANDDNDITIIISSDEDIDAEHFFRDLENLSFVTEVDFLGINFGDDDVFIYEFIITINEIAD